MFRGFSPTGMRLCLNAEMNFILSMRVDSLHNRDANLKEQGDALEKESI